jgi:acid phosphatase
MRILLRTWVLVVLLGAAGCVSTSHEPPNLDPYKLQIRAYVDSGQYAREVAAVANEAKAWIERRAAARAEGERLTVVLDVDETLLSNWPHMSAQDFGYVPPRWDEWVQRGEAPAIEPVREIYAATLRLGIDVVFLTGRRERDRAGTERNLRAVGCTDYVALICKSDEVRGTSATFKTNARRQLVAEGRAIIANIGDQQSDLVGGFAERAFKLPCPFYLTE